MKQERMIYRFPWLPSIAAALLGLLFIPKATAESRHALVIGNNAYENARALVNPKNDAVAIAAKLRGVGFEVTERTDATNKGMKDALREFSGKVPEGSVCLIYYAGHGVQIKGQNYLVPIDAKMAAEYEVPDETLCMDTVVRALGETKSKLNIFVLDCCRDDPFARSWRGSRSVGGSGGLVMPADMPQGMFVAFSTSPNTTAEDGDGNNSPYATALLEELGQPGYEFEIVFKNAGAKVAKVTNGRQEPWTNSKFYGNFSFVVSAIGTTIPASKPPVNKEREASINVQLLERYRAAANKGDRTAQGNLGYCYWQGHGVSQNDAEAVKWYRKAAEQGDAISQYRLAQCYNLGRGVHQDDTEALKWHQLASKQGYARASGTIGAAYHIGRGVKMDIAEALKWYRLAAEQGDADAQSQLGNFYAMGEIVPQDYTEAVKWYRKASLQGSNAGHCALAGCYASGKGVVVDESLARILFLKAADQGNKWATFAIGKGYFFGKGLGVTQDLSEAIKWFQKAADLGEIGAYKALGECNEKGLGVKQDDVNAYMWYEVAYSSGDKSMLGSQDKLKKRMTKDQIAEAQLRAENWRYR